MLRTHEYVSKQLTKRAMELLLQQNQNAVRYFYLNGCQYYMCWLDKSQLAFGSGEMEIIIHSGANEHLIIEAFMQFFDGRYAEKMTYTFWREINTMDKLQKESPGFDMWNYGQDKSERIFCIEKRGR